MDKHKFISSGLLEQYVLGLTTLEENKEVEAYLEAFPELKEEVRAMEDALMRYAASQSIPPSPHKRRIIQSPPPSESGSRSGLGDLNTPVLFVIVTLVLGSFSFVLWQENKILRHSLESQRAEMSLLEQHYFHQDHDAHLFSILAHQDTKQIELTNHLTNNSQHTVVAYWNPTAHKAILNASALQAPPQNHQYQLWYLIKDKYVSASLLESSKLKLIPISYLPKVEKIMLTIEPTGGSRIPNKQRIAYTGEILSQ
jgi:anti-sigma-K factor RskA